MSSEEKIAAVRAYLAAAPAADDRELYQETGAGYGEIRAVRRELERSEQKQYALQRLREAFEADPELLNILFGERASNRFMCSKALAEHPTFICRPPGEIIKVPTIGLLGLINGLLCQPGDPDRLVRDLDKQTGNLVGLGFRLETFPTEGVE